MQPIPFADAFLVSSILTLLAPTLLLIALVVWYMVAIKKVGRPGVKPAASGADGAGSVAGSPGSAAAESAHGPSAAPRAEA